jgi:cyanophycin synthetase
MVVEGRLMAAVRREPPFVIGDGRSNVGELVARLNERRRGTPREAAYLSPVAVDVPLKAKLAERGLSLESVLGAGERHTLLSVANRSTGGSAADVTEEVHPQVKRLAEMLASAVGLRTAGIDYITTDISRSPSEVGGGFIEVNTMPGLGVLMAAGRSEDEIASLVLGDRPGRIRVTLVTGVGEGLDQVAEALTGAGSEAAGVAIATPGSAKIGAVALPLPGLDTMAAVNAVLRYGSAEALTIVWPLEEVYRYGAPVDEIERVVILGPPPPDEWLSLLHRLCPDIVFAPDADAAIAAASAALMRAKRTI